MGWNVARLKAGKYLESAWSDPTPLAHRVASEIYLYSTRLDDALAHAEQARALDPKDPENLLAVAKASIFVDRDRLLIGLSRAAGEEIAPPNELPPGWGRRFEPT